MRNITFINAGAGSGKTHRLTEVLADRIINHGVVANEVLLTTFTKKAAKEIRERAQAKLLDEGRLEGVTKLQSAFMGTVHSIGYQFIKKYWYLIGVAPDLTELENKERDAFFSHAISDEPSDSELTRLNDLCYQFDFQSYDEIKDFKKFNKNQWKDDVIAIIDQALTNNIDVINDNSSLENSLKKWKDVFTNDIGEPNIKLAIETIEDIVENNRRSKDKYQVFTSTKLIALKSRKNKRELRTLFEVDSAIKFLKNYVYNTTRNNDPQIREALDRLAEKVRVEQTSLFKNSGWEYINLVFDIAKRSLGKYKAYKNEKGLVDYTDMEVHFLDLLDKDIVKTEIENSIKLVLVDEFQDSNPIQLSIFIKLSQIVGKQGQSYWVGDPKQAIYGFRGSDPILIDKVIKQFGKKENTDLKLELLKMSWRSLPELVTFANSIFEGRMLNNTSDLFLENKSQIHGPDNKGKPELLEARQKFESWLDDVSIDPLSKKESIGLLPVRESDPKISYPIQFWHFLKDDNKRLTKVPYYTKLSQKVASIIKEDQIRGCDICILVNSNKNVVDLAKEFNTLGIPVNAVVDGLPDTVEYRMLHNIITLFLDPYNGLSSAELAYLCGEVSTVESTIEDRLKVNLENPGEENDDVYDRLKNWLSEKEHRILVTQLRKQSGHLSVYSIIEKIISQFNLFQKLTSFKGAALRQANLLKILKSTQEYEEYCEKMNIGSSLSGLFDFIEANKEHMQFATSIDNDAVNIMTYHKSKGLEWQMVILMDIENKFIDHKFEKQEVFKTRVLQPKELNLLNPLEGRKLEFLFWPFGTSDSLKQGIKDNILADLIELEANKRNERSRLMYVGITRARDYLVFASNEVKNAYWLEDVIPNEWTLEKAMIEIGYSTTSSGTYNLCNLMYKQPGDCDVYYEKIQESSKIDYDISSRPQAYFKKQIPESQSKPYVINPSSVKPMDNCSIAPFKTLHGRLVINTKDSTELGNTLHHLLYIKDRSYFNDAVNSSAPFDDLGIDPAQFIQNTKRFNDWLNSEFNIVKEYQELSMEVEIGSQLAKGEADLVLETSDGLILIDYKSYAGNDDVTNDKNSDFYAAKYSGQLDLYAQMLEKTFVHQKVIKQLVYYVVQGKIVELKF